MGEGFRVRALYGTETVKAFIPAPISECTHKDSEFFIL
jgi:hypothetical protein